MKRDIIKINEELCNGCGACVRGCHEGALQMIDGKARIVSELYCDGLGACIGDCPLGAIEIEEREAEPYSESAVMERIALKGEATILAHLRHLKDHGETLFLQQGVDYLRDNNIEVDLSSVETASQPALQLAAQPATTANAQPSSANTTTTQPSSANTANAQPSSASPTTAQPSSFEPPKLACGCPGSMERSFVATSLPNFEGVAQAAASQLTHWPVQLHLLNPQAGFFRGADVVIAADCTAYAYPDLHNRFIKGKTLAIACPKLDSNKDSYIVKITEMIDSAQINTLTVIIMEVPCCGGLIQLAQRAAEQAIRKVPIKKVVIGVQGEIVSENWI